MTARTFRLNVVAAGGFNPGSPLLFDGFDYSVTRLESNATAVPKILNSPTTAQKWTSCKRRPDLGGELSYYMYTVTQAEMQATTGYTGPLPGTGSRCLKFEMPIISGDGHEVYLGLSGSPNIVPANVWFQFWYFMPYGGSEFSLLDNRHKMLYPSNNAYPSSTCKWLVSLSTRPMNTISNDVATYGDPSPGRAFIIERDNMVGTVFYSPGGSDNGSKIGPNLQTADNAHLVPNQWQLVKIHLDTSNNASGVFESWIRPYGGSWRKVSEWIGGVTPNFSWSGFGAGGHSSLLVPSTVGWATGIGTTQYMYMDDFAMATSEANLPTYG